MSKASGIALVPPNRRNPAKTTTLGTGQLIGQILGLRDKLKDADLVITGEGRIDFQTQFDKAPAGVAAAAREAGVPCVAICGAIGKT